ncbi:hypothetical protein NVP1081O_018 [Vibrio phage 1.081.O._10N.286.52.C2]|nr:hypothetical protein NVP1081O_018 [Vibrio phage 1.081.O._10N.286.52.C2]
MNIFEQAFAEHDVPQVEVPKTRRVLLTPCGIEFQHEPMYNMATKQHDCIMFTFNDVKIVVDREEDCFHEAYCIFKGIDFVESQSPIEKFI